MALINKKQEYQDQETWFKDIQKVKGYKEFKEKVEYWAKRKNYIGNLVIQGPYEIVYDNELCLCVDIEGNVNFNGLDTEIIPLQFRNVSGWFGCSGYENLTSLKGCPVYVGSSFDCGICPKLTSLEYCPRYVGDNFYCSNCGKHFTKENVQSLCDVKGEIWV